MPSRAQGKAKTKDYAELTDGLERVLAQKETFEWWDGS